MNGATSLREFLERANKVVDKGEPADVIYLDFQKLHKRLLKKSCGERQSIVITQNWLGDRKQNGNEMGNFHHNKRLPRGSVLGLQLLLTFIDDLEKRG